MPSEKPKLCAGCGQMPIIEQKGIYWRIICPAHCALRSVMCTTLVGVIGKWNRSQRMIKAVR